MNFFLVIPLTEKGRFELDAEDYIVKERVEWIKTYSYLFFTDPTKNPNQKFNHLGLERGKDFQVIEIRERGKK